MLVINTWNHVILQNLKSNFMVKLILFVRTEKAKTITHFI